MFFLLICFRFPFCFRFFVFLHLLLSFSDVSPFFPSSFFSFCLSFSCFSFDFFIFRFVLFFSFFHSFFHFSHHLIFPISLSFFIAHVGVALLPSSLLCGAPKPDFLEEKKVQNQPSVGPCFSRFWSPLFPFFLFPFFSFFSSFISFHVPVILYIFIVHFYFYFQSFSFLYIFLKLFFILYAFHFLFFFLLLFSFLLFLRVFMFLDFVKMFCDFFPIFLFCSILLHLFSSLSFVSLVDGNLLVPPRSCHARPHDNTTGQHSSTHKNKNLA